MRKISKKGVPQSAKISKLEWICSKFPSQLEFGGEHLFGGTARGVLFFKRALFNIYDDPSHDLQKKTIMCIFVIDISS